jgi:hypothetical protein
MQDWAERDRDSNAKVDPQVWKRHKEEEEEE